MTGNRKSYTLKDAEVKARARIQKHTKDGLIVLTFLDGASYAGAGYFRGDEAAFDPESSDVVALVILGQAVPTAELSEDERFALTPPNQRPSRFPHLTPAPVAKLAAKRGRA